MILAEKEAYVYRAQGAHKQVWSSNDKLLCLYGAAGTGKTRTILEKLFFICENFAKVRVLIARKTRDSLNETVLETWENEVVPDDHFCRTQIQRRMRQKYTFENGSEIILGGLDNPNKILSSRYDIIYIPEAIEVSESDVETLMTRLRGFNFKYQQMLLDTNPGGYDHWIYKRFTRGGIKLIKTTHKDNPLFWDEVKEDWTPEGRVYVLETLALLTGQRRQKYFIGDWGFVDGAVYSDYNEEKVLIDPFPLPPETIYWAGVDFGFNDPFVFNIFGNTTNKNLYLVHQIYFSRKTIDNHILTIDRLLEETGINIRGLVMDTNNKGEGMQLARHMHRRRIPANKKSITTNIDILSTAFQNCGTDKPALYIFKNSLYEKDKYLEEEKKAPTCIEEEIPMYSWKKDPSGQIVYDIPEDKNNHGINATEYVASYIFGTQFRRVMLRCM